MSDTLMSEEEIKKAMEDLKKREEQLRKDAIAISQMQSRLTEESKVVRVIIEEKITKLAVGKIFKSHTSTTDGKRKGTKWFLAMRAVGTYLEGLSVEITTNALQYGVHLPNLADATIPKSENEEDIPVEIKSVFEYIKKK